MRKLIFKIAKINSVLPTEAEDQLNVYIFEHPKPTGKYAKKEIVHQWNGEEEDVQTTIYDRYSAQLYYQSPIVEGLTLGQWSKRFKITFPDGRERNIEFIEISEPEPIDGSGIMSVDFQFYDLDSLRVIDHWNHATDPSLTEKPLTLRLQNSNEIDAEFTALTSELGYYDIISKFKPLFTASPPDGVETKNIGVTKFSRIDIFGQAECLFFANEADNRVLNKYLPLCDQAKLIYDTVEYTKIDVFEPNTENIDKDLWSNEITIKYEVLNYYPFPG